MAITDASQQTQRQPISCAQALQIAHADAERVYRDLSRHRITLFLRPDGWYIDYDLTEPAMAGGGPHYIIDALSGAVLHKRYEQ
jgi:hypothetical protein